MVSYLDLLLVIVKLTPAVTTTVSQPAPIRTSDSQNPTIPSTARDSTQSTAAPAPAETFSGETTKTKTKEDAVLRTMSSLEGKKLRKTTSSRDILGKITRPAPLPPTDGDGEESRPVSGLSGVEAWRASTGLMGMSKLDEGESLPFIFA